MQRLANETKGTLTHFRNRQTRRMDSEQRWWISVPKEVGQNIRKELEKSGLYDKSRKAKVNENCELEIPVTKVCDIENILQGKTYKITSSDFTPVVKTTLAEDLKICATKILNDKNLWNESLSSDIASHWEKHDDLILFPINSFTNTVWKSIDWNPIAQCLKVQRLAKKSVISDDDFRSPNVEMLLGNDVWVTRKENNIHYTWNITKSMFSVGNITEKQRISKFDCQGKVIGNFCLFVSESFIHFP